MPSFDSFLQLCISLSSFAYRKAVSTILTIFIRPKSNIVEEKKGKNDNCGIY